MNRRWAGALIAVAAIVLVVGAYRLLSDRGGGTAASAPERGSSASTVPADSAAAAPASPAALAEESERWSAALYFPAANDRLVPETHEIAGGSSPRERAARVLAALLATAPSAPRVPLFPSAVEVGSVLLNEDGTLYVDLRSAEADPPPSGSKVEMLRVYALVHTVLRNIPEAKQVVLLWNGRQRPSFAGHVDTARALRARGDLEAAAPATPDPAAASAPRP
jgi:hypothetical protein